MAIDHVLEPVRFQALAHSALNAGAVYNGTGLQWDASLGCDEPITVLLRSSLAEPPKLWVPSGTLQTGPLWLPVTDPQSKIYLDCNRQLFLYVDVPCRKCMACIKRRSRLWSARAWHETRIAPRTWFCTYTLAPHHRMRAAILGRGKKGDESFSALYSVVSEWFTKYLKRVRKESGAKLRFLLAAEEHKDGFPHLHALIHEVDEKRVSKRTLQGQWPYGFTHVKLSDPATSRYVTKYISKQMTARVRASLHYGRILTKDTSSDIVNHQVVVNVFPDPTLSNNEDVDCSNEQISATTSEAESEQSAGQETFIPGGARSAF